MGVDAIAFLSMTAALALGQSLAAIVVAIMYAGGTVLEDFAVARAERSLKSLVDRAPRIAHRRAGQSVEDVSVDDIKIGETIVVRAGEVIPVDGLITSSSAVIDESALTGEPIPVTRLEKDEVRSGTLNAGETFSMKATATAGDSTYAGIVRLVTAAQTACVGADRRSYPRSCGLGRSNPVSSDPRGAGRLHRRGLAISSARNSHQRRRCPRSFGANTYSSI
jgi:cation transport ATPase